MKEIQNGGHIRTTPGRDRGPELCKMKISFAFYP
jgi:hypothetical protein